jgi:hypothetical protein
MRISKVFALVCLSALLAGCDTDLYGDTDGCRDNDSKTECPTGDFPSEGAKK